MTQASFARALVAAMPELRDYDNPFGIPPRDSVSFSLEFRPTPLGILVGFLVGDSIPTWIEFGSEQEAVSWLTRAWSVITRDL